MNLKKVLLCLSAVLVLFCNVDGMILLDGKKILADGVPPRPVVEVVTDILEELGVDNKRYLYELVQIVTIAYELYMPNTHKRIKLLDWLYGPGYVALNTYFLRRISWEIKNTTEVS
jgi:hypothetical protein